MTLPPRSRQALLMIGDVARRTGKAASTIRYYEEIRLITPPERIGGRRHYPTEVVRELAVIETAQRAGLSLEEIRLLLQATPDDHRSTERLRAVADRKLPELKEAIARAQIVRRWLEDAALCHCPTLDDCPLFDQPTLLPEPAALGRGLPVRRERSMPSQPVVTNAPFVHSAASARSRT